jgi:cellulose synthase/poly-beta-1,6-N-acetylglucosamine synthase-like glycosyltransferase/cell division protein FtsN
MEKIIEAYELEKVNYYFDYRLSCNRIRGVYKSRNRSFKKLMVVDKQNGGKSDALNAGLNVVKNDLIVCIDADSIMEQDALLRLVKPFLEEKDKKVIGTGGVIRIANSCEIVGGKIKNITLPKKWLPRAQVMEYTRAFLIGRISWSELDGLLLISGALGMFDRETVIKAGGYDTETVGEDMELVVRIRRYMADQDKPYRVEYIPDPLCWTEVPSSIKTLARQRSRWTRGTIETLYKHRRLLFNGKYGKLGLMGYPYWLFFEWLAPIMEFIGILIFIFLAASGKLNLSFFLLLLGFVYFFAVSLSIWSVLFEEITFHKYDKRRDVLRLVLTAFLEPLFFHPIALLMTIKGNIDKIRRKTSWGKHDREGFNGNTANKEKKTRTIIIGGAIAAAAAAAVIWFLVVRKPDLNLDRGSDKMARTELKQETANGPEEDKTAQAAPLSQEAQEKEPIVQEEEPIVQEEEPIVQEEEPIVQEEEPIVQEEPPADELTHYQYHLIVGSFKSESYAFQMADQLKHQGYAPEILSSENGFYRVAVHPYAHIQDAMDNLDQLRKEPGMERAWILTKAD